MAFGNRITLAIDKCSLNINIGVNNMRNREEKIRELKRALKRKGQDGKVEAVKPVDEEDDWVDQPDMEVEKPAIEEEEEEFEDQFEDEYEEEDADEPALEE